MFVVTKMICESNNVEIVELVDEVTRDMGFLVAYDSMLEDALQYDVDDHSIKNKSKTRIEVYYRGSFGNSLKYVYQIHMTHDTGPDEV